MEAQNASTDESTHNQAVIRGVDAARMKASDIRNPTPHAPVDHASQAALRSSPVTGGAFETAYDEVFLNTWYAHSAAGDTVDVLERIYAELLRIEHQDENSDDLVTDGGQEVVKAEEKEAGYMIMCRDTSHQLRATMAVESWDDAMAVVSEPLSHFDQVYDSIEEDFVGIKENRSVNRQFDIMVESAGRDGFITQHSYLTINELVRE
jgi:hypothetical protein